jgi:hypothetical protein
MAHPVVFAVRSLQDNHDTQSISARPTLSYEDMGYTNVIRNGGAVTTRCKRSMGWETPTNIDDNLLPEFAMLRVIKTPSPVLLFARCQPTRGKREAMCFSIAEWWLTPCTASPKCRFN